MAPVAELQRRFLAAGSEHRSRSPLYARLGEAISDDPMIASLLASAPERQQLPVLLFAAVHSMVLEDPTSPLAAFYASVTPEPHGDDPYPAFRRHCLEHEQQLRSILATRSVQTNEVGRCCLIAIALGTEVRSPIGLIDVGTSAGLNLLFDRYRYTFEPGGDIGPPSDVRLHCETAGPFQVPVGLPQVEWRAGVDRDPIDVRDPDDARWLLACVWPDQTDRIERLRAALAIARHDPSPIERGDATDVLPRLVSQAAERGIRPTVVNTWVLNYLTPDSQAQYAAIIDEIGATCDLTWVYAESPGLCPGIPFPSSRRGKHGTVVVRVDWDAGVRTSRFLGDAHAHGYWFRAASADSRADDAR